MLAHDRTQNNLEVRHKKINRVRKAIMASAHGKPDPLDI